MRVRARARSLSAPRRDLLAVCLSAAVTGAGLRKGAHNTRADDH
jgi:hypothetical protein